MKMLKQWTGLIILLVICFIQPVFGAVRTGEVSYTLGTNRQVNGNFGKEDWYFYVEEPWEVTGAKLNLVYLTTQLIRTDMSTITLYLNEEPFYSFNPSQKFEADQLEVGIPLANIKEGFNKLSIKGYLRLSEERCTDSVNPANWLNLFKESQLTLTYTEANELTIGQFPYPIMRKQLEDTIPIIIAKDYTDEELAAALELITTLGEYTSQGDEFFIKPTDNLDEYKKSIIIGNEKMLSIYYPELTLPREQSVGILLDRTSDYDRLILCGNTKEALERGIDFLGAEEVRSLVQSNYLVINEENAFEEAQIEKGKSHYTLEEMGLDSIYMTGQHRNEANVFLKVPNEWILQKGAKLVLHTRYSKNLDFEHALVTLYINDQAVSSSLLDRSRADDDTIELTIPQDIRIKNNTKVTIAFDLEINKAECITREEDTPWGLILKDSYFYLPAGVVKTYAFEMFPYPFVKEGVLQPIQLVLPKDLNQADLKVLSRLFTKIGANMSQRAGSIYIIREAVDPEYNQYQSIIYEVVPQSAVTTFNTESIVCTIKPKEGKEQGELKISVASHEKLNRLLNTKVNPTSLMGQKLIIDSEGQTSLAEVIEVPQIISTSKEETVNNPSANKPTEGRIQEGILVISIFVLMGGLIIVYFVYRKNK